NTASDTVSVLHNSNGTALAAAVAYPTPQGPACVVVGKFDAGLTNDVVVACSLAPKGALLPGDGAGNPGAFVQFPIGGSALDLDLDGMPDVVVACSASAQVKILPGNGDGTFDAAVPFAVGTGPNSVAIGVYGASGKVGIAVTESTAQDVYLLLHD